MEDAGEKLRVYFKGIEANPNFSKNLSELSLNFDDEGQKFSGDYCMSCNINNDRDVVFVPVRLNGDDVRRAGTLVQWRTYLNYYVTSGATNQPGYILRDQFPGIRVGYLLEQIFGSSLETNPFKKGIWRDLYLQTLQKKDWVYPNPITYTSLQDYLPKIEASRLVGNILNMFCASVIIRRNKYHIVFNRDIFNNTIKRENLSKNLLDSYTLSHVDGTYYLYGCKNAFKGVPSDEQAPTPLSTQIQLQSRESDTSPDMKQFIIAQTGQTVQRARNYETESRWKYNIINSGFGYNDEQSRDDFDMTTELQPMDMTYNTVPITPTGIGSTKIYTPQIELSDLNYDKMPRIMWYHGMMGGAGSNSSIAYPYPGTSPYCIDVEKSDAPVIKPFSLQMNPSDTNSIFSQFHSLFQKWVEQDKLGLRGYIMWGVDDIANVDYLRRYHIKGRDFILRRYTARLTRNRLLPVEVEMESAVL